MNNKTSKSKEVKNQQERDELLQNTRKKVGMQLRVDISSGAIKEVDELKELLKKAGESPEEKYNIYYLGIRRILMRLLPKGPEFKQERDFIYDEKNIFLNRGKRKSDNNGVRGSDGRMTYQPVMDEMLDVITQWATSSQNPFDLYTEMYNLNERHGYGHEVYDDTAKKFEKAKKGNKAL